MTSHKSPKLSRYLNPRYLKNPIVTGTFFLTLAGLITKLIGFFYRIFLSRIFKEEGLGVIGLISPVLILVHSVFIYWCSDFAAALGWYGVSCLSLCRFYFKSDYRRTALHATIAN